VAIGNSGTQNSEFEISFGGKALEIGAFLKYWFGALSGANQKP
jgi:hypothetical protein